MCPDGIGGRGSSDTQPGGEHELDPGFLVRVGSYPVRGTSSAVNFREVAVPVSSTVTSGSACLCLGKSTLPGQTLKGPVVENAGNPARRPALQGTSRGRWEKQLRGARTLTPGRTGGAKKKTIEQTDRSPGGASPRSSPRRPKTGPGRLLLNRVLQKVVSKEVGLIGRIRARGETAMCF